jgi:hypothetical protein
MTASPFLPLSADERSHFSVNIPCVRCAPGRAKRGRVVRGRRGLAGEAARPSRRKAIVDARLRKMGKVANSTAGGKRLIHIATLLRKTPNMGKVASRAAAGRPRPGRAERDPGKLRRDRVRERDWEVRSRITRAGALWFAGFAYGDQSGNGGMATAIYPGTFADMVADLFGAP